MRCIKTGVFIAGKQLVEMPMDSRNQSYVASKENLSLILLAISKSKDNVPTPGIPTDGDIKESAADENSVVCLVGAGIVDRNRNGPCTSYNTEEKCIIIGIVKTINPD